jgi:hypothetical protein
MKKLLNLLLFAAMLQIGTAQISPLIIDAPACNESAFFEGCSCICHQTAHTNCNHSADSCVIDQSAAPRCSLCLCGKQAQIDSAAADSLVHTAEEIFFRCGLAEASLPTIYNSGHFHCSHCQHLCGAHCLQTYTSIYPRTVYHRPLEASDGHCQALHTDESHAYELYTSQRSYEPLRNAHVLTKELLWIEHEDIQFSAPFPVFIDGEQIRYFIFSTFLEDLTGIFTNGKGHVYVRPLEAPIIDRGEHAKKALSAIQYQTTGAFGNRIFKIEWRNVGSEDEHPHACQHLDHYLNFQVWFYEAGQHIEFRYGPSSKNAIAFFSYEEAGVFAGIQFGKQGGKNDLKINGNPQSPDLSCKNGLLWDIPANGTVYRLSPRPKLAKSAQELLANSLEVHQDFQQDLVHVKATSGSSALQLFNLQGQLLLEGSLNEQKGQLNLAGLPAGFYLLRQVGNPQAARVVKH